MTPQQAFVRLFEELQEEIIGQQSLVERLLVALLTHGHLLVEGAPGLAKTTAIKQLALRLDCDFHRIQFTPDLLPADLTGTEIFRPQTAEFEFRQGPLFYNLVLADEVNRAPAKVQAALLEAMAERQVTVGRQTYPVPDLFLVMATQNPIEQEGTYPLPEAQLDRFLLHVRIDYPDRTAEKAILDLSRRREQAEYQKGKKAEAWKISQDMVFAAQQAVNEVHLSDPLEEYLVELVCATRDPGVYSEALQRQLAYGASPRATLALDRCARARAWLRERDYVLPEDIQAFAPDVLRHRLLLSFEAEAEGATTDGVVKDLLERVPIP